VGLLRFFDWLNRWQVVVATVLILAGFLFGYFYLGLQLFSH
jgi:hypothetical protein